MWQQHILLQLRIQRNKWRHPLCGLQQYTLDQSMALTAVKYIPHRTLATVENSPQNGKKATLFMRFKQDFTRYWYVMFPIHVSTSFGYFLGFYYLSKMGVSPIPLMDLAGVPKEYVDPLRDSAVSHAAIGYAAYKLITPLRYLTTIALTGVTTRTLSKRGYLKPMPSFEEFVKIIKRRFLKR